MEVAAGNPASTAAGRIRVGLIGAGRHGQAIILPALRFAPIDVVACSSVTPSHGNSTTNLSRSPVKVTP